MRQVLKRNILVWRVFSTILFLSLCATAASADAIPRYDVETYCREVSDISGGSEVVYGGCFDMEQGAYNRRKAAWNELPSQARKYCDEVARVSGGSYVILDGCLDMENEAGNSRKEFQY
jgi:hypothetical protein